MTPFKLLFRSNTTLKSWHHRACFQQVNIILFFWWGQKWSKECISKKEGLHQSKPNIFLSFCCLYILLKMKFTLSVSTYQTQPMECICWLKIVRHVFRSIMINIEKSDSNIDVNHDSQGIRVMTMSYFFGWFEYDWPVDTQTNQQNTNILQGCFTLWSLFMTLSPQFRFDFGKHLTKYYYIWSTPW